VSKKGTGEKILNLTPSVKSMQRIRESLRDIAGSSNSKSLEEVVRDINRVTRGWKEYFNIGYLLARDYDSEEEQLLIYKVNINY